MSDTKHSPGPWSVSVSHEWPFHILTRDASGQIIARDGMAAWATNQQTPDQVMAGQFMGTPDEVADASKANHRTVANAVLRAAAPALLKALSEIVASADRNEAAINTFLLIDAREAIAEATKDIA